MKHLVCFLSVSLLITSFACAQLKYTVMPENPRPGEPVTIGADKNVTEAVLIVNGKQAAKSSFFVMPGEKGTPGYLAAILTIPSTVTDENAVIKLNNAAGTVTEIPIVMEPRVFESETIALDPVNTGIRTDTSPQRTRESNILWQILSTTGNQVYHTGPFILPVESTRRTSLFGYRRIYKYSNGGTDTSIHAGIDFGVPRGTRVVACGNGRVVLAAMRIVTGYTVILEHAPGIYSLYYHMDRISVKEGDILNTGDFIGLSGSTGLSTGPHLHWEIRISTENTDPDYFLQNPLIDKDLLINKIYKR